MRKKSIQKIGLTLIIFTLLISLSAGAAVNVGTILFKIPPLPGELIESHDDLVAIVLSDIHQVDSDELFEKSTYDADISSLIQQLSTDMTIGYIQDLTSFEPRVTASPACFDAGKYIYDEFESMGLSVRYHNWSSSDSLYGSNIEATLPGVDQTSDEIYIVCGHYDSVSGSPGADDNAAGTSVVLSAASLMSQYHFNHTVRFVAFSGEEQGLYGSKYYAQDAALNEDNIVAVLNADMMGYAVSEEGEHSVVIYDNDASSWITDFTTNISNEYQQDINLSVVHGGSSGRSDHYSFQRVGYHAIFYFEYEVNPYYHNYRDTLDNMNPSYATNVSRLALATVSSLAEFTQITSPNQPQRPQGETTGQIDETYEYTTRTTDPDGDPVWYMWQWGDGSTSEWIGPFQSGEIANASHTWTNKDTFEIRVKAKDSSGGESTWSEPLSVTMPKRWINGISNRMNGVLNRIFPRFHFLFQ
jgi:hypothetical protein